VLLLLLLLHVVPVAAPAASDCGRRRRSPLVVVRRPEARPGGGGVRRAAAAAVVLLLGLARLDVHERRLGVDGARRLQATADLRHCRRLSTRQRRTAGFAPGTPCTMDSSCLGTRRRTGHDAISTTQQGRYTAHDDAMTSLAATVSHASRRHP